MGRRSPRREAGAPPATGRILNHQYNEMEELRKDSHGNQDRHFEMFLERSRFTGWMFTASIFIAAVVLFKVLMPFQDLSEQIVGHATELASLKQEKAELSVRRESLQDVSDRFSAVQKRIEEPRWGDAPKQLANRMRQLNRSYRVLLDASDEDLKKFIDDRKSRADAVGFLAQEVSVLPASFQEGKDQSDPAKWMAPPIEADLDGEAAAEVQSLTEDQLDALQAYFEASELVRDMGLLPDFNQVAPVSTPAQSEPDSREEPDMIQQPAWMDAPPPSIADSIRTLHVKPEEILNFATFRERDSFLYEQFQVRAQEEAHQILNEVTHAVQGEVVDPLKKALSALDTLELAHISDSFGELEITLNEWKSSHEADTGWYQTIAAKGETIDDLGQSIGNVLASTSVALSQQSVSVLKERVETSRRLGRVESKRDSLKESKTHLQSKLDSVMPAWAAGVVTAHELIQIFPMLLILLVVALAYNVWIVRDHFLLSRIRGVDTVPYKAASLWTLVQRGGFRTLTSLVVFLSGLVILWFSYEQAAILMTRWAALDGSEPWMFTGWISEAAPWIGRTVFLAGASAVVLTLLWREQTSNEPLPNQA